MDIINVKVVPNSKNNQIIKVDDNFFKIKIKAQPEKGKANKELIKYLSRLLEIPKSEVAIINGQFTSLKKISLPPGSLDKIDNLI